MSNKAYITPDVLKWARETAKISVDAAASRVGVKKDRLLEWESKEKDTFPTIRQSKLLANYYRRPFAVLYLPKPPKDFQTLQDFRRVMKKDEYSTALTFMIRELQQKQKWIRDKLVADNELILSFINRFNISNSVAQVANDIKKVLGIETIKGEDPLRFWVKKAEAKRIFVSLGSNIHSHLLIDIEEVRGFSMSDKYAPFVFVNTHDFRNSQLFTLVHEIVHLWIGSSGVSDIDGIEFREKQLYSEYDEVEIFCNAVTAEILMPEKEISKLFGSGKAPNLDFIEATAKKFGVSSYAMLVRLLNLQILTNSVFEEYKLVTKRKFEAYLRKEKEKAETREGFPPPHLIRLRKNSKLFTNYVYNSFMSGEITGVEASLLMGIKINNFRKIENYLVTI